MFSSVGSWITAGVEAVAEKVGADIKLDDQYNDKEQEGEQNKREVTTTDQITSSVSHDDVTQSEARELLPIWEEAPKQLAAHRDEWKTAILGSMQDENTFIVSINRLKEEGDGVQWTSVYTKLGLTAGTELEERMNEESLRTEMEAHIKKIQEMLIAQQLPDFNQLRYKISPHYVLDDNFWSNFRDKLCLLSLAPTIPALLDAMEAMNTEPNPVPVSEKRRRNVGVADNSAVQQQIRDAVNAKTILSEWIAKKKETSLEFLKAGKNSYSMLKSLLEKRNEDNGEGTELLESVAESCKYHKTKIGGIVGELSAPGTPEKLKGSGLEMEGGAIMEQLLSLNDDLHSALDAFSTKTPLRKTVKDSGHSAAANSSSPTSATRSSVENPGLDSSESVGRLEHSTPSDPPASATTTPQQISATPSTKVEGSVVTAAPTTPANTTSNNQQESNEFNAELPWDDDE